MGARGKTRSHAADGAIDSATLAALEVGRMASPRRDVGKSVREFAGDYLLPAAAVMVAVVVLLGLLTIGGLVLALVLPIALTLAVLAAIVLLAAEMLWRVAVLDLLLGLGASVYAVNLLIQEPLTTFVGGLLGGLTAALLHLSGEPMRVRHLPTQALTDATGQNHPAILLNGDQPHFAALVGSFVGLLALLICWALQGYGLWSLFWGLYATLAIGRALSWFSVEADLQRKVFWQPFAFLRHYPPFHQVFHWWRQTRRWLGIGLAQWSPWGRE